MSCILSLISSSDYPAISSALMKTVRVLLPQDAMPVILNEGIAAEIVFNAEQHAFADLCATVRQAIGDAPIDVNILPNTHRRKKLLIADMDSTMIEQECIDELADVLGIKEHVSEITERAMRGEIEFEPALRERVALLKDLPIDKVKAVISERITLTPGGKTLLATMKANGAYTALVSGGFTVFTDPISKEIGFDEHTSNTLGMDGDKLSGAVLGEIVGRQAKQQRLEFLRDQHNLASELTLAVGDGANDLDMIHAAGLGVAFKAKPAVRHAAKASITHGDLTGLLYLQGYKADEFQGYRGFN